VAIVGKDRMTMSETPTPSNPADAAPKDPDDWTTGDEPMTGAQASYLSTLAQDTGRDIPESRSKAKLPSS
jgi:hypothetical protein